MSRILPALFLLLTGMLHAQKFEIPAEKFPFFEIIEWKGQGAILLNRDPSFNLKQVHMTLVSNDGTSTWNQSFNPAVKEFYFIAEDGGKYAYFLNDLTIKDGKISFNQLNIAGNIKTHSTSVLSILKRLGNFLPDDLTVTDIVTTERALVYMLTHMDKSTNKKTTIALTITHHNLVAYAAIVAENNIASSKAEDQVSWYVAGEEGESILYAARIHSGKDAGWVIKQFSPKGEYEKDMAVKSAGLSFAAHERTGFGRRGSALLKINEPKEQGTLLYSKGSYYVGGLEVSGTSANLVTYVYKNAAWVKMASSPVSGYNAKKTPAIGFFPLLEGIGWYVGTTAGGEGHFHSFTSEKGIVSGKVAQQLDNPSRLLTAEFPGQFVSALPTRWLVFDTAQLPSSGAVTFEYVNK